MAIGDTQNEQSKGNGLNRRRQYLVNPGFQWKYTISLALVVFLITTCLSSVLYGLLHQQARQRVMHPETYTASVGLVMVTFAVAFSMVTALGVGIWCFFITHRICGPLFVIDRYLRQLANGAIPKLRPLRKKDEFKDLFATFSRATDALRERKQQHLTTLTKIATTARSVDEADDASCKDALASMTKQLDELRGELAAALGEEALPISAESESDAKPPAPTPVAVA